VLTAEQICNVALARVGQRQFIDSLDEDTTPAELCAVLYPAARDSALALCEWPFATKSQTLALLNYTRSGWAYAYSVPTDMVASRYLFNGVRPGASLYPYSRSCAALYGFPLVGAVEEVPFAIALSDDGKKQILVTDQEDAELVYTSALTVVPVMPQLFQDAVVWALARDLALSLPDKAGLANGFGQQAELAVQRAWAQVMNSQQADPQPDSSFITVRR
jgi:hypothetical protein